MRQLTRLILLVGLLLVGGVGLYIVQNHYSSEAKIRQLEAKRQQLEEFVQRLGTERRVAEALVTDQKKVNGTLQTTILFVEIARDGTTLPARTYTLEGTGIHIDAMVIKFEQDYVASNDPLRGHSIALFTRLFGDTQSPANAFPIDKPGEIPEIYRGATASQVAFEETLWKQFWKLADDPEYAKSQGIRIAQGQSVWRDLKPGMRYTLTVESNGGLNMVADPVKGVFSELLRERMGTSTTQPK